MVLLSNKHLPRSRVLLPGLHIFLWNEPFLRKVDESKGRVVAFGKGLLDSNDKRVEKVLLELDLHEGLLEDLEIEWNGHIFYKILDYLKFPFRCIVCHEVG